LVADKGYHSRETLKTRDGGPWKARIAEPKRDGFLRWHGDAAARRAVVNNRTRLLSGVARAAFRLRAEVVERGFALTLDRGGMRRAWLRGRENLHKRYLVHVAGYNLGLIMRPLTGAGTPREFQALVAVRLAVVSTPTGGLFVLLTVAADDQTAAVVLSLELEPDHSG
jgi:transposase